MRDLERVPLTAQQDALLIGTLLGDGAMRCKTIALLPELAYRVPSE